MESLKYRYVSNAGLLLWDGKTGIGIDVFCKDENGLYRDLPEGIRKEILSQIADGKMHAMIITHEHSDHFFADDVAAAWELHKDLPIFTTKTVQRCLEAFIPAGNLVVPEFASSYETRWFQVGDFRIGLMSTVHEGAQYADIQNLCVMIEHGQKRILVTGDALPDEKLMEAVRSWCPSPDMAFVPFPLVGLKKNRRLLTAYLDIKNVFAYHLPKDNVNVNWVLSAKAVCDAANDGLADPVFAEKIGKWYPFTM